MLYGLKFVPIHPVYKLHGAVGHFLNDGLKLKTFGKYCVPAWFRPVFTASPGLRSRLKNVFREARKQTPDVCCSILRVWKSHDNVQALCENVNCIVETWGFNAPELIVALSDLFSFLYENTLESAAFEKVAGGSLRQHYTTFRELGQRVCPFCGLNFYADRESGVRSSYDHFLPRVNYPLAAVNFKNLVPMCDHCNEPPRKGMTDVLFRDKSCQNRRRFYYPYSTTGGVKLSIKCAKRPKPGDLGSWEVKVKPIKTSERDQVTGWNSVFVIETRYAARVRESVDIWIKDFLSTKEYSTQPSVTRLRQDLAVKARWLSKPEQLRTKIEAALQSAAFRFLADEAPEDMLAGYAATALSPAVVDIPSALKMNRAANS